jgi:hypothetical protein
MIIARQAWLAFEMNAARQRAVSVNQDLNEIEVLKWLS